MQKLKNRDYLPRTLAGFVIWYLNFAAKFNVHAVALGMEAKKQQVMDDATMVEYIGQLMAFFESGEEAVRAFRDTMLDAALNTPFPGFPLVTLPASPTEVAAAILERLFKLVDQIEAADGYTLQIGEDLGIVVASGGNVSVSPDELQPVIKKISAQTGGRVDWNIPLKGEKAYNIYSKRGAEQAAAFLKTCTESDGFDDRPNLNPNQPEVREYEAVFVRKGEETGSRSQPVKITTEV